MYSDVVCSDQFGKVIEERRAYQITNVAGLDGTSRVNDGDRLASNAGNLSELVTLNVPVVLAFAEGCAGRPCLLQALCIGEIDWDGTDA